MLSPMNLLRAGLFLALVFPGFKLRAQQLDSLDIKIGQMLLIGYPGTQVDPNVLREIATGKVGSIILFEKNVPPQNSFAELKKVIWTYQQQAPIPLFVAIDQEGGRVNRLKPKYGFPNSITAEKMGSSPTLDSVRFYGESTASTLAGLGINVNFAPVVDLASNPDNPIIARPGRAFSANPDSVAMMARAFIKTHRQFGVITVLKHFPGHGSSKDDTHLGIADVTATWDESELFPYIELLREGEVDAIMSAHIVNRKLDPEGNPGTLSTPMLTGILREQLGYDGVVFSDDMQMHAITKHYGLDEAVKKAILAGIDVMTFSNNISGSEERTVDRVHQLIRKLVESGVVPESRIDASFRRVMALKRKWLQPAETEDDDELARNREAWQREMTEKMQALEAQNARLQSEIDTLKMNAAPAKKKRKRS